MKILFYDGSLVDFFHKACADPQIVDKYLRPTDNYVTVDAYNGPTDNYNKLSELMHKKFKYYVVTNSLVALSHVFGWNDEEKHTDIYLWREKYNDFIRCDKLTMKEVREAHNIEKMYMAGTFDEEIWEIT